MYVLFIQLVYCTFLELSDNIRDISGGSMIIFGSRERKS